MALPETRQIAHEQVRASTHDRDHWWTSPSSPRQPPERPNSLQSQIRNHFGGRVRALQGHMLNLLWAATHLHDPCEPSTEGRGLIFPQTFVSSWGNFRGIYIIALESVMDAECVREILFLSIFIILICFRSWRSVSGCRSLCKCKKTDANAYSEDL